MSDLAALESALWHGEYHRLADSHSHRATREDCFRIAKGRDAIQAQWIAAGRADVAIGIDLEDMIAVQSDGWRLHRWVWREDGRILREVEITDRTRELTAPAVHPPLGELRAGRGQYAASASPDLSPTFPDAARALTARLHGIWNGRDFSADMPSDMAMLIEALPDATVIFEHAVASDAGIAILFRLLGHHANGQRVRLIGSCLATTDETQLVIDLSAYRAQLERPLIDYSQP